MGKLLFDESPLVILPTLARKVGLNEAIALQQLHYWLRPEHKPHMIDGVPWIFNSTSEWQKQFPFWSGATIWRTFASLEQKKLVRVGSFNKLGFDRTKWYTIDYQRVDEVEGSEKCIFQNETSIVQDEKSIFQNEISIVQDETTIPETTHENTQESTQEIGVSPEIPPEVKEICEEAIKRPLGNDVEKLGVLWQKYPIPAYYTRARDVIAGRRRHPSDGVRFVDFSILVARVARDVGGP